jgi:gas vesicle protein
MLAPLAAFIGRVSDRRSHIAWFSLGVFAVFFFINATIDRATIGIDPKMHVFIQGFLVGLAAAFVSVLLLSARRERRRILREEIERVVELNHRIRNSLQVITDAHFNETDDARKRMISEMVQSMDQTMKQLFPTLGLERRHHNRKSYTKADVLEMRRKVS